MLHAARRLAAAVPFAACLVVGLLAPSPALAQPDVAGTSAEGDPGTEVAIDFSWTQGGDAAAIQLDLTWDPAVLDLGTLSAGDALVDHSLDWSEVDTGRARVTVVTATPSALGDGRLFTVPFTIATAAPEGAWPVAVESLLISSTGGDSVDPREVTGGEVIVLASAAAPVEIPTLGTWSLALLTLLLLVVGLQAVRGGAPLLVFVAVSLAALSLATPARAAVPAGDANGDGNVDSADIPVIVDQILERGTASGDPDCNGDSSVDVRDTICVATTAPPEPNEAPVLDAIADLGVREREIVGFVATATDPDLPDDELAWSLLEKPVGATIDPSSGSILWVPTGDQVGASSFRVRVTDAAGASDEETFTVDVRALGGPPILEKIADREVVESDALSLTATATDPDLPDDALAFDLMLAPAGMGIDAGSGEIAWTPGTVDVGLHDVTVRVTDQEGLIDFTSFVVDVREVNVAPVANDDVFEARLGVPLSVEAPGVLDNDSDANGDVLTSVLDSGPAEGDLELEPDGSFDYLLEPPDRTTPVELERVCESKARLRRAQSNIAVGDVDADGVSEIVAAGFHGGTSFIGDVVILNPIDCTVELNTANTDVEAANGVSNPTAVGLLDIDGDGDLEIIGTSGGDFRHLIAFHHDATLAWPGDGLSESSPLLEATPNNTSANHYREAGPTFADLDGDGTVEIVMAFKDGTRWNRFSGLAVYDASDGSLVWEFLSTFRQGGPHTKPPTVVDLDLDGTMEVIVHNSVVDHNGVLEFELPSTPASGTWTPGDLVLGIANVDDDPFPELFGRDRHARYLFEHDGTLTRKENEKNSSLGQIAVADFDGDGAPEFSFLTCFDCGPGPQFLVVYDTDGSLLWSHEGQADFLHRGFNDADDWNPTAFDANRDGAMDLVIANKLQETLSIFDGRDGSLLGDLDFNLSGVGGPKFTAIADVDQDGDAEIVKRAPHGCCFVSYEVWSGTAANPLPAAPTHRNQWIFQEAYNNPDGSIPTNPLPHWLQPGRNGWNLLTPEPDPLIGTTQTFTYHANDGALDSNEATVTLDVLPAGNPPRFLSDPDALTTRGFRYAYAPIVVDPDLGDVVTFHLTAGPDGMTIDPATGAVEWLPDTNGTYPVTILATDTIGFAVDQSWDLVVGDPVTVPDVVGLPQATAESQVTGASLLVGRTSEATHPSIPSGSVSAQTPVGGSVAEFGAEVDLVVSLGPAPEDVDDDGDGFTETGGDCNDNDGAIHPGAPDPPGDGIDQDCDGFDGSEPVAEVVVEPETLDLLAGESRQLKAWAVFADGTAQIATGLSTWQSLNLTTATVTATGRLTAVADTGPAQITATLDAIVGTADVTVTDADGTDDDAPTVEITSPEDGESVFGPVDVLGTADDPNLVRYELLISPAGEESFTQIGGGTSPVVGGVLGELDPTLLLNGLYTLRLAVLDAGGNETMDEVTVQVEGQQKVGNFTISFVDLEIPVSGIPIQVVRTYDSRDKQRGDFGIGWRLGLRTVDISCTSTPGEGWQSLRSGLSWVLAPTRLHRCSVNALGGQTEIFDFVPDPQVSPVVPFSLLSGSYVPVSGTQGTLEVLDSTNFIVAEPQPGEVTLRHDDDLSIFDPQRFRYTAPDGTRFVFGPSGLEEMEDTNGNVLTIDLDSISHSSGVEVAIERDAMGRIIGITDPEGHDQSYTYSAAGDLVAHADQLGHVTRYFYDQNHGLIRIEDPLGRPVSRTEYDDDGRIIAITDGDGNRREVDDQLGVQTQIHTDPDGSHTVAEYDDTGNILRHVDGVGAERLWTYDAEGNVLTTTNPRGGVTTYTRSEDGRPLTVTDPEGNVTTYTYDSFGKRTSVTDAEGATTSYEYDSRGNVVRITDSEGGTTERSYDAAGQLVSETDPLGSTMQWTYDGTGNLISLTDATGVTTSYTYDNNGRRLSEQRVVTRPEGSETLTTTRSYDAAGQLTSVTLPDGSVRLTEYDETGAVSATVDPLGRRTLMERDWAGRPTLVTHPDGESTLIENGFAHRIARVRQRSGAEFAWKYDGMDRVTELSMHDSTPSEGDNPRIEVEYALDGLPLALKLPGGVTNEFDHDDEGKLLRTRDPMLREVTRRHDGAGRVVEEEDALGRITSLQYDGNGQRIRTIWPDGSELSMTYDAAGRLVSRTDEDGETTAFEYDPAGRLIAVVDPLGSRIQYAYDEAGNLVTQTDALGRVTRWEYDDAGRRTGLIQPSGRRMSFAYDAAGNLVLRIDFNGDETTYDYSNLDQLIAIHYPDSTSVEIDYDVAGRREQIRDGRGMTTFEYDVRGRLVERTNPDGTTIAYTYDDVGRVQTLATPSGTVTYDYDLAGAITSVTDQDGGSTTFAYDAVGNLSRVDRPNGWTELYQYDNRDRPVRLEIYDQSGALVDFWDYEYDPDGIRTVADGTRGRREWVYDDADRLLSERIVLPDASVRTIDYTYDAVGNRLTRYDSAVGLATYSYDVDDRLLKVVSGANTVTLDWDDNGNLTSLSSPDGTATYDWNTDNRLVEAILPGPVEIAFEYNVDGLRTSATVNGIEERFLWDTNRPLPQMIEEYQPTGPRTPYLYGAALLAQGSGGSREQILVDVHSGVRRLVDGDGASTGILGYDAFGRLLETSSTDASRFLYRAEQRDQDLDWTYLRARYYDQETGRFVSEDPFEGLVDDPGSRHRYLYAKNSPVSFMDPTGLWTLPELQVFIVGMAGIMGGVAIGTGLVGVLLPDGYEWNGVLSSGAFGVGMVGVVSPEVGVGLYTASADCHRPGMFASEYVETEGQSWFSIFGGLGLGYRAGGFQGDFTMNAKSLQSDPATLYGPTLLGSVVSVAAGTKGFNAGTAWISGTSRGFGWFSESSGLGASLIEGLAGVTLPINLGEQTVCESEADREGR